MVEAIPKILRDGFVALLFAMTIVDGFVTPFLAMTQVYGFVGSRLLAVTMRGWGHSGGSEATEESRQDKIFAYRQGGVILERSEESGWGGERLFTSFRVTTKRVASKQDGL